MSRRVAKIRNPTSTLVVVGFFLHTSFSFSLLNKFSAMFTASPIGSVLFPMSCVANTSAENLIKSMSAIKY